MKQRKHPRLKEYDYSTPGTYGITICTKDKQKILSNVVGRGALTPPLVALFPMGEVVESYIQNISVAYEGVTVDKYVIMPNHVHLLITIHPLGDGGVRAPRPTTHTIIRSLKTMVTRQLGVSIWQTSYYDRVIQSENEYQRAWNYVENNPAKWLDDEYY